jgi:HPt (histidine-containing phosphotransfer) domain-containing protein
MGKKLILTESELYKVIRQIIEQTEDEYYKISPEDYLDMMKYASNNGDVFRRMKRYGGKPLYITGDLDLSGTDVKDLGPIAYVDGSLNIRNTKVSDIGGLQVKRYIIDSGTPRERIREKQELNAKMVGQESLRDSDEWALEQGDETGEKAHALFQYLESNGEIEPLSEDDREKLVILRQKLEDLEREYEELDDNDDRVSEVQDAIDETQEEIEELESNDVDVYMMYPSPRYTHYGLTQFEVLIDGFKDKEYTVGTEEEMDAAALEYAKNYIDDVGVEGLNESFIEDYLDVDAIVEMAEEDYDYQVRDYPASYFNDDDFELTYEQEQRIEQLESQIEDLEQQKFELDSDDENYNDYEEDLDNQIEALQEELESIEVETEPTEEMIENKVAELVRDVRRDPLDYLKNYGFNIKDYIDEDALAQGLVDSDGWGVMNSYDGNYDSEEVNGITYYIMRVN